MGDGRGKYIDMNFLTCRCLQPPFNVCFDAILVTCLSIVSHRIKSCLLLPTGRLLLRPCGCVVCRYADCLLCRQSALLSSAYSVLRCDVMCQHVPLILLLPTLLPLRCNRGVSEAVLRSVHPRGHLRPAQQRSHAQIRHS
jgi:hypothetical protein